MSELPIGEVARRVGIRTSAVRYYESRGLIAPDGRKGGKRVYGEDAVERLALISFAKDLGFTLADIQLLLTGFAAGTRPNARWSTIAETKLVELETMSRRIDVMRAALQRISHCGCNDLDECARGIAAKSCR